MDLRGLAGERDDSCGGLMGLSRSAMPAKVQLLAVMAFALAMLFIENQIQRLEESRAKLGTSSADQRFALYKCAL